MSTIDSLRPKTKRRVIDLVREAGIDVGEWANIVGGKVKAAGNPKYCYEWSFLEPNNLAVLNLWHNALQEHHGVITFQDNTRANAANHARLHTPKGSLLAKRSERFDEAVKTAASRKLPVRVIICTGTKEDRSKSHTRASKVAARELDPAPWAVTEYDSRTGKFTLTRGAPQKNFADQFMIDVQPSSPTETRNTTSTNFVRDGAIRQAALTRANGRCEWCQKPGFIMANGSVFLETHHIIPLSEGGPDETTNVVALCPNHHREAHYGATSNLIRDRFLKTLGGRERKRR